MLVYRKAFLQLLLPFMAVIAACNSSTSGNKSSEDSTGTNQVSVPDKKAFQASIDGKETNLFLLNNKNGARVAITNYGGRIVGLWVPDKNGKLTDVVVGLDAVEKYQNSTEPYFGALIGRYGNRIAKGKFELDGKSYTLFTNNGPNTLHGGKKGFQDVVWDAHQVDDSTLELSYLSKDMEAGFPGNLSVKVVYTLTDENELKIDYRAETDKKTVVNLTNHAFFNLNGEGNGTILNHTLQINANKYTPVDSTLIPTGEIVSTAATPFDFAGMHKIGERIDANNEQLKNGKGYDHNFVLNVPEQGKLFPAAKVVGDISGITMEVLTVEPGLQFYSGNFMQGKNTFKSGAKDDFRTAFCLETQHFPDSPNQASFPSTELDPGKVYKTSTVYKFYVQE